VAHLSPLHRLPAPLLPSYTRCMPSHTGTRLDRAVQVRGSMCVSDYEDSEVEGGGGSGGGVAVKAFTAHATSLNVEGFVWVQFLWARGGRARSFRSTRLVRTTSRRFPSPARRRPRCAQVAPVSPVERAHLPDGACDPPFRKPPRFSAHALRSFEYSGVPSFEPQSDLPRHGPDCMHLAAWWVVESRSALPFLAAACHRGWACKCGPRGGR
jgi:hypothetical protein